MKNDILIITLSGKAGHGKDTVANMLKEKLANLGHDVLIMHYADQLKFGCMEYKKWDGKKDVFGRSLLQQVGTEQMRAKYPDFWVDNICKWINGSLYDTYDIFILADARYPNEIEYFFTFPFDHSTGVCPIKVVRLDHEAHLTKEQQEHSSETSLDDYNKFHYGIYAKTGLDKIEKEVDYTIQWMKDANILPKQRGECFN